MRQSGCARLSVPARAVLRQRRLMRTPPQHRRCRPAASARPAQIYHPMRVVAELDGPARIDTARHAHRWARLGQSARQRPAGASRCRDGCRWKAEGCRGQTDPATASRCCQRHQSRRICGRTARISIWPAASPGCRSTRPWSTAASCRPARPVPDDRHRRTACNCAKPGRRACAGSPARSATASLSTGREHRRTVERAVLGRRGRLARRRSQDHGPRPEGPVGRPWQTLSRKNAIRSPAAFPASGHAGRRRRRCR